MCAVASWDGDAWIHEYPSYMGIDIKGTGLGLSMTMYDGRPALDFWNYRFIATNPLELKRIYQICVTKQKGSIKSTCTIYVNGKEVAGSGNSDNAPNITDSKAVVGRLDERRWANAKIYNVKYYNRALTKEEINTNYNFDKERFNF